MYVYVLIITLYISIITQESYSLPKFNTRIIGGKAVGIRDHPYQVSLQYFGSHVCGGVLISSNYALTAAHCITEFRFNPSRLSIYAGSRYNSRDGIRLSIQKVAVHGRFDNFTNDYDIAIIKFEPIKFNGNMLPIALIENNAEMPTTTNATVTGWGHTKENGNLIPGLKAVTIPIIDNEICKSMYFGRGIVTERMLCAGFISGGSDSCQGDSGGPLVGKGKLIGLVSWGYGCGRPNSPGVYTKISKYRHWINVAMKELGI